MPRRSEKGASSRIIVFGSVTLIPAMKARQLLNAKMLAAVAKEQAQMDPIHAESADYVIATKELGKRRMDYVVANKFRIPLNCLRVYSRVGGREVIWVDELRPHESAAPNCD